MAQSYVTTRGFLTEEGRALIAELKPDVFVELYKIQKFFGTLARFRQEISAARPELKAARRANTAGLVKVMGPATRAGIQDAREDAILRELHNARVEAAIIAPHLTGEEREKCEKRAAGAAGKELMLRFEARKIGTLRALIG
jgi:hypothetical protein